MNCELGNVANYTLVAGSRIEGIELSKQLLPNNPAVVGVKAFYDPSVTIVEENSVVIGGAQNPNSIFFTLAGGEPNQLYEITFQITYEDGSVLLVPFVVRTTSWIKGSYTPPVRVFVSTAPMSTKSYNMANAIVVRTTAGKISALNTIKANAITTRYVAGKAITFSKTKANATVTRKTNAILKAISSVKANATNFTKMPAIMQNVDPAKQIAYFQFDGHLDSYTSTVARVQRITNANVTVSGTQTLDVGLNFKRVFDWDTADAFRAGADLVLVGFLYNGVLLPVVKGGTGQMWMWKLGYGRVTTRTDLDEATGQLVPNANKGGQACSPLAINTATDFAIIEQTNSNFSLTDGLEFHVYWQPLLRKDSSVNVPTGTYSQSGTTLTITQTAHGLRLGQLVTFTPTTGSGLKGTYAVQSITSANIFVVTASNSATNTGNCTVDD
jgi:hypothetical protein